jgi:hypothetical protein
MLTTWQGYSTAALIRQDGGDANSLQRLDISHSKARCRVKLIGKVARKRKRPTFIAAMRTVPSLLRAELMPVKGGNPKHRGVGRREPRS